MTAVSSRIAAFVFALAAAAPAAAIVGYPDPSFGSGGAQWLDVAGPNGLAFLYAVAVAPDGRIVALASTDPGGELGVVRRLADGTPDVSFGNGLGALFVTASAHRYDGWFQGSAMAPQPDGKIVVVGRQVPTAGPVRFLILRVLADGSGLDATFGDGGIVALPPDAGSIGDYARAVVVQANGRIVVAGETFRPASEGDSDMLVVRLASNGRLDGGFGDRGRRTIGFDQFGTIRRYDGASALALQPDGKIVVAGASETSAEGSTAAVARLTVDGDLDPAFGTFADGRTRYRFDTGPISRAYAVAFSRLPFDADGASWRLVVAGWTSSAIDHRGFGVAVLDGAGKLDPGFDGDGKKLLTFNTPPFALARDAGYALAIESGVRRIPSPLGGTFPVPYRKIVVAGSSHRGSHEEVALARIGFDGTLDDSFGFGGQSLYSPHYSADGVPYYCHTVEYSIAQQGAQLIVGSSCFASFDAPERVTLGRVPLEP